MTSLTADDIQLRASLALDAAAVSHSLLDGDMDEARFRATLLWRNALNWELDEIMSAAAGVVARLGPPGTRPVAGVGHALLRLCRTIELPQ